jgi:hypothetical protein
MSVTNDEGGGASTGTRPFDLAMFVLYTVGLVRSLTQPTTSSSVRERTAWFDSVRYYQARWTGGLWNGNRKGKVVQ